jgi:rhamnosyltransferase
LSVGIVIVLFNPDVVHIEKLLSEFNSDRWSIVLVDNSSEESQIALTCNCKYIHCPSNVGIAEAQNIGLRFLFSQKYRYSFLLDQDSQFSPFIATRLFAQYEQIEKLHPIAALGPAIHCQFSNTVQQGVLQKGKQVSSELIEVKQIIASGMLLSKDVFEKVGAKEASLFIDGVDHEWCWRAKSKGFRIFQSLTVSMPHRQGDNRIKVAGVTFKQGASIRLYYQFRNVLVLSRRRYVPFYWKCRHLFAIPLRYLINRFVFESGQERGRFMIKGLKDGLRKNLGPFKEFE